MIHHPETQELMKVAFIGTVGTAAGVTLTQVSVLFSLGVSIATLVYVCAKIYFLFKNKGRVAE